MDYQCALKMLPCAIADHLMYQIDNYLTQVTNDTSNVTNKKAILSSLNGSNDSSTIKENFSIKRCKRGKRSSSSKWLVSQ